MKSLDRSSESLLRVTRPLLVVVIVAILHIATCPLVYRLSGDYGKKYPVGGWYLPWEVVVDNTPLSSPLMSWAGVFDVGYEFGLPADLRAMGDGFDRSGLSKAYPLSSSRVFSSCANP